MTAIHLFDLAFRRNEWLGAKQAAIAGNIANANTPGFKAQRDVVGHRTQPVRLRRHARRAGSH